MKGLYPKLILLSLLMFVNLGIFAQSDGQSLVIYPNPLLDKATLEISTDKHPTEIVVYNIIGKAIHKQELTGLGQNARFEVDFSFLSPGVYFLNLLSNRETLATRKIVKKS